MRLKPHGRGLDVAQVPPLSCRAGGVICKSTESAEDTDYLLTVEDVGAFEAEHGSLPDGSWWLLHAGWNAWAHEVKLFLNAGSGQLRSLGFDTECAGWIAKESLFVGVSGVEIVGIDAGRVNSSATVGTEPAGI